MHVGYLNVTDSSPSLLFCQYPLFFVCSKVYGLHPNRVPSPIRQCSGQSLITQNRCHFFCRALAALCCWHLRRKLLYFGRRNWFLLSANSTNQESSLEVTVLYWGGRGNLGSRPVWMRGSGLTQTCVPGLAPSFWSQGVLRILTWGLSGAAARLQGSHDSIWRTEGLSN